MILPALQEAESPYWRPIKYSLFPPLGLATLAAYFSDDDDVEIQDQHVEKLTLDDTPDLVCIQVYVTNAYRAYEIADAYRQRGGYVAMGGLHVTSREKHMDCFNHPLGRPPKEENDVHLEDKKRAIGERNEVEATFGTSKRVYRANNIRAKLDETADTWIGACFFAKNVMKFLRGLLRLIFGILGQKPFMGQLYNNEVCLVPVCDRHRQWHILIN